MMTQAMDGLDLRDPTNEAVGQHLWGMDPQVDAALQERIGAAQEATRQQNETEAAVRSWPGAAANTPDPVRTEPAPSPRQQNEPIEPAPRAPSGPGAQPANQAQPAQDAGQNADEASSPNATRAAEAASGGTSKAGNAEPEAEAPAETGPARGTAPPPEMISDEALMQRYPRQSPWSNQGVFATEHGVLEGQALADYVRTNIAGWTPHQEGHCHAAARLWSARDGQGDSALDEETRGLLEQQFPGLRQAMTLQETSPHEQAQAAAAQATTPQDAAMAQAGVGTSSSQTGGATEPDSDAENQQAQPQQPQQGPSTHVSPQQNSSQQQVQRR